MSHGDIATDKNYESKKINYKAMQWIQKIIVTRSSYKAQHNYVDHVALT